MQRELSSFPLPPVHRMKLQNTGFVTVEDLVGLKPSELSKEIDVTNEEALNILKLTRDSSTTSKLGSESRTQTALQMLKDEQLQQGIVTFSQDLDCLLGGGVPLTKITEFCGAPGVGKTQICMQLSVDVQIPECFGGIEGEAVYIDTEGSFLVERLADMVIATIGHCQQIANAEQNKEQLDAIQTFTLDSILSNVHCFRCHNYTELIALVHMLPDFLHEHEKVKLIVVDSVAFHFRHDFEDYALRTRLLNGMAQSFIRMATDHRLAVVLTNQMTTKIVTDRGQSSHLVPALGESWGHASTIRVILYWENSQRYAMLYKSPSKQEAVVPYQVTTGGIRDVPQKRPLCQEDEQPQKKQRIDD